MECPALERVFVNKSFLQSWRYAIQRVISILPILNRMTSFPTCVEVNAITPIKNRWMPWIWFMKKCTGEQLGEEKDRFPVTFIWDEYMANMLALQSEDKKAATQAMNRVSEILMLGRSLSVRFFTSCQRPDASAFPSGSRLNYGIILILGWRPSEVFMRCYFRQSTLTKLGTERFRRARALYCYRDSVLRFIKIPVVSNMGRLYGICQTALTENSI